jgi:hypothetical protein
MDSEIAINGRFNEMAQQRDVAQLRCIMLAGRVAELEASLAHAQETIKQPSQPPAKPLAPLT